MSMRGEGERDFERFFVGALMNFLAQGEGSEAWAGAEAGAEAGAKAGAGAGAGMFSARAAKNSPSSSARIEGNGLAGPSSRSRWILLEWRCEHDDLEAGVGESMPSSEAGGVGCCAGATRFGWTVGGMRCA